MRTLLSASCCGFLLAFSTPATASMSFVQPQTQGDVTYITGGITTDERTALNAQEDKYNVKLVFAHSTGGYLSDTAVTITSKTGDKVLNVTSDGPFLYTTLKPGSYTVQATDSNRTKKQSLTVSANQSLQTIRFYWPKTHGAS